MNTKEIIQKLLKGETLTDDERTALEAFDPDKAAKAAIDSAAAAARRKAEEELAKAQADLKAKSDEVASLTAKAAQLEESLKGNAQQGSQEMQVMRKQLEALTKRLEEADAKAAKLEKDARIDALIAKAGFNYGPGFSEKEINGLLHAKLQTLDDEGLKDLEEAATPFDGVLHGGIFKAHRETWKGALLDETGKGSGSPVTGKTVTGAKVPNPWKAETSNLTQRMVISKSDPQLAARMKAEAGFTDP